MSAIWRSSAPARSAETMQRSAPSRVAHLDEAAEPAPQRGQVGRRRRQRLDGEARRRAGAVARHGGQAMVERARPVLGARRGSRFIKQVSIVRPWPQPARR